MSFTSFNFWIVFPIILIVYWVIPSRYNKARNIYLLLVSYLLYMLWKPAFALALLGVTIFSFVAAIIIDRINNHKSRKRLCVLFTVVILAPLLVFKYYNFINDNIYAVLSSFGITTSFPEMKFAVPIGLSFFTFQALGYFLDVYLKRTSRTNNITEYALFVSFFPQIVSGPISKKDELLPQITNPRVFEYDKGVAGLKYLLWGMFFKLVFADRLGLCVDNIVVAYEHLSGLTCFIGSILYSLQIYGDFAGYSFMAVGIAKLLGFDIINNFKQPYFSLSVTEFWRRWHISLSRWLKDYVYIPLGGSRCSKVRNYANILITFLVSGIWHGANWTFIVWGLIHGFFQAIEKALGLNKRNSKNIIEKITRVSVTFLIVNFAWIFFRMPTIESAIQFIKQIFVESGPFNFDMTGFTSILCISLSLMIVMLKDINEEKNFLMNTILDSTAFKFVLYSVLFAMVVSLGVIDSSTFIYLSF